MSSPAPSVPSHAPTPPSPRDDSVATWTAYEGRQQEYEHQRDTRRVWELARAQTLRSNEASVPEAGPVPVAAASLAPSQFTPVPEDARVSMEDASTEAVTRALRRPWGPPTLLTFPSAPIVLVATRSACSRSRLWGFGEIPQSRCVVREQGWDLAWMWAQMGKKSVIRVAGPRSEGGESASVVAVVPRSKCKAAPVSGPVKRVRCPASPVRPAAKAGSLGSRVFSPRSGRPLLLVGASRSRPGESQAVAAGPGSEEAELRRERDRGLVQIRVQVEELTRVRRERDEAVLVHDQLLRERVRHLGQRKALEGEVGGLLTRLVRAVGLEGMAGVAVPSAVEVNELARRLREAHALESRRREWLLWEVAAAQGEALDWAWEHCLLLDRLSSGVSYVLEEASSAELPPNLVQGVARLGRLMSVHCHRNLLDPRSWLEVFVDGLEDQLSIEEIMQIIWNAMAVEFGPGGNGPQEPAGKAQGPVGKVRGLVGGAA
ncbi:hypothetical protein C0992_004919 [Termitomyces sp. T32_za158]|nr:hypothetical protein C0992_004919 [Termitomyces sp. T32_za158]